MAEVSPAPNKKLNLSIDLRIIILVLVLVIIGMLVMWRPWHKAVSSDRTVKVTGETTLKAEPDEFVFYPTYQFSSSDNQTAINNMTQKSDELVAKLKALGVPDSKIKTSSNGSDYIKYGDGGREPSYFLSLTVTVDKRELAKQVQDYLVTTAPTGSVSPQTDFSKAKRKELESKARDEATKDARAKADQSAKNLGFKVGKVKSIEDGSGFGDIYPLMKGAALATDASSTPEATTRLSLQPGENELSYSVTVTYFVQ